MIDLEVKYLTEVKSILKNRIPHCEVGVFGSRVEGSAKKYSDLDLVLVSKEKIDWRVIEELKDTFAESDLPFIVDILDWNSISDTFQKTILEQYEIIQKGPPKK